MARFWYETLLPMFGEQNVKLLYSGERNKNNVNPVPDTDSFYCEFLNFDYDEVLDR